MRLPPQWSQILELPWLRPLTVVGLTATLACLVIIALFWNKLPPLVPLWYSRSWGDDQLASRGFLLILPLASLIWLGLSLTLASGWQQTPLFAKLLIASSTAASLLSLLTIINILLLVT